MLKNHLRIGGKHHYIKHGFNFHSWVFIYFSFLNEHWLFTWQKSNRYNAVVTALGVSFHFDSCTAWACSVCFCITPLQLSHLRVFQTPGSLKKWSRAHLTIGQVAQQSCFSDRSGSQQALNWGPALHVSTGPQTELWANSLEKIYTCWHAWRAEERIRAKCLWNNSALLFR